MKVIPIMLFLWLSSFTIASNPQSNSSDYKDLIGYWIRPDGGYTLVINGVDDAGNMNAQYYNPKSINVAEAKASLESDRTNIYIEMQDVGYPGSSYSLTLDSEARRLVGTYYHAISKKNIQIYFVRGKN